MTANAGYHAYATGDVLTAAQVQYNLQNQTTMYFASAAARTTALTGVLVEGMVSYIPANGIEYYNGSAWVSISQAVTALTTKGDLLTYSTQDTRLPVGSDGQTLVANSAATTGLQWQTPVQQNPVLNSAMQVWQRGTSAATYSGGSTGFGPDRWQLLRGAAFSGATVSRQVTNDTTNLPNIQYCARVQRDLGITTTTSVQLYQNFETINSIPFAGKQVTLSFYARAGANYSAASSALVATLITGTGTDQNAQITPYSGPATPISQTATLTTTWQRFQYTGTISTTATEISPNFGYTPVGTAGANDYFEITGVQLEVGQVASPFHTFSTTIQGELAACQRYYWRSSQSGDIYGPFGMGYGLSTTTAYFVVQCPVPMRTAPSTTFDYSNLAVGLYGTSSIAITALALSQRTLLNLGLSATVASGLTANRPYQLEINGQATGFLGFSAEL